MKRYVVNVLATTGLSLIVLSVIALICDANHLEIASVFETFAVNIVIHIGLLLVQNIECRYAAVEFVLDVGFVILVLIVCGTIFGWFTSTPIGLLAVMAIVIYLLSITLNLFRMQQEANEINALLQRRNKKNRTDM